MRRESKTGNSGAGQIKKKAQKEGRTIVFIDESGLSQRPHRRRTWAPRGQTPVLQFHFNWKTLSVIAGVTSWNFYFQILERAIRSEQIIGFLKHLLRYIPGDIRLIWDRLPAHRSRVTQQFIPDQKSRFGHGVPAGLCAATEPGGIHLGSLQTPRTAQCLRQEPLGSGRRCPPFSEAHAPSASADYRILETGFFIRLIPLYYAEFNK